MGVSAAACLNLPVYGNVKYSVCMCFMPVFYITVHSTKLHDVSLNYLNKTTEIHAAYAEIYDERTERTAE